MKIQHHISSALALLALVASTQASAGQITLNATGVPGYLNNGSYSGLFDGSALLPGNFAINSIGFSFLFGDDSDTFASTTALISSSSVTGAPVVVGPRTETVTTTVTNRYTVTRTGGQEGVTLSFGSVLFSGQTALSSSSSTDTVNGTPVATKVEYKRGNGDPCTKANWENNQMGCKQITYKSVTDSVITTNETDYKGQIALSSSLLSYASLLADLGADRKLGFGIQATGDLNLLGATLNIDYSEVPEPGSLALFGAALLGLAGMRRARRA